MNQAEFIANIGAKNIAPDVEAALRPAREIREGFSGLAEEVAGEIEHACF
ncbi:MAG: hypothetical protein ABSG41_00915 [Bryobacteraceae bacterium]|jgi:hypothetical protein